LQPQNSLELYGGIVALLFIGWCTYLDVRLRIVEAKLLVADQEKKDAEIESQIDSLSNDQLDADIERELSPGTGQGNQHKP
jgi:hypothetical protein